MRFNRGLFLVFLGLLVGTLMLPASSAAAAAKKVNLNTATQAELEALPGIGPALAQKIIAARPFTSVDDLKNVSGIGQSTFDGLKDLVTVGTTKTAAATETKATTATTAASGAKVATEKLTNINTATKAELEKLPGITPALAKAIIAARPFKNVSDLKNVKGIDQAALKKLKKLVTVEEEATKTKTAAEKTTATTAGAATTGATTAGTTTTTKSTSGKGAAQTTGKAGTTKAAAALVDLNTADKAALVALPGIGPALADKIIAARPFKSVDDLKNVSGIGQAKFDAVKGLVTVGEEEMAVQPKLKPGETININTAGLEDLEKLLGIGPVKAQAIIDGRPYAKIEDIMTVKGIKEKTFAKIKAFIVVK
jgi:competence protein ComEA